jgi:hypothetical protein
MVGQRRSTKVGGHQGSKRLIVAEKGALPPRDPIKTLYKIPATILLKFETKTKTK